MSIRDAIRDVLPEVIALRHDLHAHPELGYDEVRTAGQVTAALTTANIEQRTGIAKTGIVGYLPSTQGASRTVALRADMDALPILEETNLPYASQTPGKMHACGHDGHTSILVGTARVLAQMPERPQNVIFLFQPAEEGGAGGMLMRDEGALSGKLIGTKADAVYGLHGHPNHDVGHVSTRVGPLMASAAEFKIIVHGKGAHAAYPHLGVDPIVAASHIVVALQSVASRNVDPLDSVVVTIGIFEGGVAHNVIPETVRLRGTMRTLLDATYATARERVESLVRHTAEAFGARAEVIWGDNPYPVTVNHPEATERFRSVARQAIGTDYVHEEPHPSMGGEDFSYYGAVAPACFYFLGVRPRGEHSYPNLHSPRFDFNDDAIATGIELMVELALRG
jgi:amidohydrolase